MYRKFYELGLYSNRLNTVLSIFPSRTVRCYFYEDLIANPRLVVNDIFDWLQLGPIGFISEPKNQTYVKSVKYPKLFPWLSALYSSRFIFALKALLPYSFVLKFRAVSDRFIFSSSNRKSGSLGEGDCLRLRRHYLAMIADLRIIFRAHHNKLLRTFGKLYWLDDPGV